MTERKTLFIIDDDEDDKLFLHEAMNDLNIPIDCYYANNGEAALKQLRDEGIPVPDFIFLDLNMPKLNGRECLVEIKKLPRYLKVPVIIYSTSSHQKDKQEIMQLGADYFLTKPTRISDLCTHLMDIFSTDWKNRISRKA
jgi:Response regulator containing CheY-like receiver, AAA-type ATPase, and DNA-binding domains